MKRLIGILIFIGFFGVIPAQAYEGSKYLGVNFSYLEYSEDYISEDFNPTGLIGKAGYIVNKNFAVEGRLGFGLSDDEKTVFNVDASLELDNLIGIYGKGLLNITEKVNLVGLVGLTRVEGTVKANGYSESDDDSGLSFGVGCNFLLTDKLILDAEYMRYLSKSDFEISGFEFGISVLF